MEVFVRSQLGVLATEWPGQRDKGWRGPYKTVQIARV